MNDRRLSIFDLDHTLIRQNSSFRFSLFLLRNKVLTPFQFLIAAFYYFCHHYCGLSLQELHRRVFDYLLKGLSPTHLQKYVERFVEECLGSYLYMPAVQRLRLSQQIGERTAIFSNSPDFLVAAIARYFQVDEWRATSYCLDEKQCFSSLASIVDGEKKKEYLIQLKAHFQATHVTAYSDNHLDLPFLSAADIPIAVSPTPVLEKIATEKHWQII